MIPPLPSYLLHCPPVPPAPLPVLTDHQRAELDGFKKHFGTKDYALPVHVHTYRKAPLTEREKMFLSQECFFRYRSANRKDSLKTVLHKMEKTIVWRRTEGLDNWEARAREIASEAAMGKNFCQGFSPDGWPIAYMMPERNTLPFSQRDPKHAGKILIPKMWNFERCYDLMTDGITKIAIIYNFGGGIPTSFRDAKDTLDMIINHYPESLGYVLLMDTPWIVRMFIHLCWPFVDQYTKEGVRVGTGEMAVEAGDLEGRMLIKECGGQLDLPWNFEQYWSALLKKTYERREIHLQNWRSLGDPVVGRPERLFKLSYLIGSSTQSPSAALLHPRVSRAPRLSMSPTWPLFRPMSLPTPPPDEKSATMATRMLAELVMVTGSDSSTAKSSEEQGEEIDPYAEYFR